MTKKSTLRLTVGLLISAVASAEPNTTDHLSTIKAFVDSELARQYAETAPSDRTFNLNYPEQILNRKACSLALQFEWRGTLEAGANTLNIRCPEPQWQAYLPIAVQVYKTVVIARTPLDRNNNLSVNQLDTRRLDIGKLRKGYFTAPAKVEGYELQRTVKSGQVITPYMVEAPSLVAKGDWVTMISGQGGLTVTTTGEALKDGALGEQIPVRNLSSDETIRAWVIRKGVVSTKREHL